MKLFGPRYPEEIAKRIPPGQRLVKTWPVLHFGPIPDFDESTWNLEVNGLVDNPYSLTYAELKALGPVDVQADMHCVTGWSTLDNTWTGVPFRVLAEKAGVQEDAKWVIAHCDYGYLRPLAPGDAGRRRAGRGPTAASPHRRARLPAPPRRPERYAWKSAKWLRASSSRRRTSVGSGRCAATTSTPSPGRRSGTRTRKALAPSSNRKR